MITDIRKLPDRAEVTADLCIVGGGAAGITLALKVAESGARVVLLEGGGLTPDPVTQKLYEGENRGLVREKLHESRSRYLGGSTNCWGGWCRPLDDIDFEQRDWVVDSGWPIRRESLTPYYAESQSWLQLPALGYDLRDWVDGISGRNASLIPLGETQLQNLLTQLSPPTRFGSRYRDQLARTPNLEVMLFANASDIMTDPTASVVEAIEVRSLSGKSATIRAGLFTLAAGGIENARLLLLSNKVQATGLGNGRDMVGRYYMDHPRIKSHMLTMSDPQRYRSLYDATLHRIHAGRVLRDRDIEVYMAPTFEAQRQLGLSNSRTYLVARYSNDLTKSFFALKALQRAISGRGHFGYPRSQVARDILRQLPTLLLHAPTTALTVADVRFNSRRPRRNYSLETVFEPIPNRDSRVTLSREVDPLGLRQAVVDWRLTDQDKNNFFRQTEIVLDGLLQSGVVEPLGDGALMRPSWPEDIQGCWHHMGTTRMSSTPATGVVDADCRVHGIQNLFIAGSSVFPTVGSDSPTITIVALSLRLAEHLKARLARPSSLAMRDASAA
jgi:choline dehydrogenase-like flavoprotein